MDSVIRCGLYPQVQVRFKKKKSQYMVSHPELGSDPPTGSDQDSGRDTICSIRELLVRERHGDGLMGHFGIHKNLGILNEHFYWPNMKHDV